MPRYLFTGSFETVLHGLAHGVNAVLHRPCDDGEPDEHGQPDGSTVVVQLGDVIETDEVYPHAHLLNMDTGEPDPHSVDTLARDLPAPTLADGLAAVQAAGQHAAEALTVLQQAAAGAEQEQPGTSNPPAAEDAAEDDAEPPPTAQPATDEGQE